MELTLQLHRLRNDGNTTIGLLSDAFIKMHTLEDEPRAVKVAGETRIPAGRYEIKERRILSPKTEQYRKIYPLWFIYHLMLLDVPGFKYVYLHHGNKEEDTDACILVGDSLWGWSIGDSRAAFTRLYHYVMGALNSGQRVFIEITDEDAI